MYKRIIWAGFLTLAIASGNSIAGKIYKCTDAEGNVTFSNVTCPENTQDKQQTRVQERTSRSSTRPPSEEAYSSSLPSQLESHPALNPYSIENQLKYFKDDKARLKRERREAEQAGRQQRLDNRTAVQHRRIDSTKCDYYKARVKEYAHKLRRGYKTKADKLSDESYHQLLRRNEAEYCR